MCECGGCTIYPVTVAPHNLERMRLRAAAQYMCSCMYRTRTAVCLQRVRVCVLEYASTYDATYAMSGGGGGRKSSGPGGGRGEPCS